MVVSIKEPVQEVVDFALGAKYRGVVVTVWTDHSEMNSNKIVLNNLEDGKYGPIFRP